MSNLKLNIAIPAYNGASWIGETLGSILRQGFQDYEVIISDDNSTDNTIEIVEGLKDKRIRVFKNEKNVGYGNNLKIIRKLVKDADILFLMGQDDILLKDALLKTYNTFIKDEEIGALTRPYYWFDHDFRKPVRAVTPLNQERDEVVSIFDGGKTVRKIFESLGQLSGLAYRQKYIEIDFNEEIFPSHIYPFASIARTKKIMFLKDYTVGVRIASSQTRFKTSIYEISPTQSWIRMLDNVYPEDKYRIPREAVKSQMATHYEGLVQLKTSSSFRNLIREIGVMIKLRPANLLNLRFWLISGLTVLVPARLLRWMADNFKKHILSSGLKKIAIEI
ncbi:MAG: glycosyltransferase [Candidatus Omnitrophota bacterium]|nr:glycosyltransferase [Candidatus Omnitrophota bacterium]MBU1929453.1 glycosyltransferase [Candidatus Omnitrophota bacterium]MBU2034823.1 glycosyltransferase [Candidatus Omnitrophota bacterium]MBU2222041.1 glycosyltransferase [Candidatus Omnitrophota bacterium]MBU2258008.1 glycosyltransferase [Candidatus Omnitrophota bacterium]